MTRKPDYSRGRPADRAARAVSLNHPGVVAAVVGILGMAGALVYAGGAAASVAYCLLTDGAIIAAWLGAAAGWGAWPTSWLLRGGSLISKSSLPAATSRWSAAPLATITAIAFGLGTLSLLELGLGLAGALGRGMAFGLVGVGWTLGGVWLVVDRRISNFKPEITNHERNGPLPNPPPEYRERGPEEYRAREPEAASSPRWNWLWLLAAPLISVAVIAAMFPAGMLWKPEEPHGYDAVEYHLQVPREWFEGGRIVPLEHNVFSYFPFGVEMHYLLAMQLKGGGWPAMYLAQLMHLSMFVLAAIAACGFAGQLTSSRRIATIASVSGATIPWIAQLAPLAFNEGGLLLFGTMTVGWTLLALRDASSPPSSPLRKMILAGLMAGFACGVKLTGVPLFLLAIPLALLVVLVRRSPGLALRSAFAFGIVGTLAFSPWLIRNIAWCGNPVFPQGTGLFGQAHFTDAQVQRWNSAHAPRADQQQATARLAEFGTQVLRSWQFGYVLLPLGVVALVLAWRRIEVKLLALLLLMQAVFWLGFTHLQGRFFVPAIPLAALAIAAAPWEKLAAGRRQIPVPGLAVIVVAAGILSWWNAHERLSGQLQRLRGDEGSDARRIILANDQILANLQPEDLWKFPNDDTSAKLILVGDAQAFQYPIPSSRIRYRTPFDVRHGDQASVLDAYGVNARDRHTWLRIDPDELLRFIRSYPPFPRIPDEGRSRPMWQPGSQPYVVRPGEPVMK